MNTTPHSRVRRSVTAGALATLLLAGCGISKAVPAADKDDAAAASLAHACAASTKRNGVVHCAKLFPGKNPIRLPNDPSRTQRYGAMKRGGQTFHTRAGDLPLAAIVTRQLSKAAESGRPAYANTVYLATISKGAVIQLKPVLYIEENAVLSAAFAGRVMEGKIGARTGPDSYDGETTLPLRIEFAGSPAGGKLTAKITNAARAVHGANGTCLPALNRTKANPLVGRFTADIAIQRVPSMHAASDDELILIWSDGISNMGQAYYPSVATLLGGDPLGRTWETLLHGTPSAGPPVDLRLVSGRWKLLTT